MITKLHVRAIAIALVLVMGLGLAGIAESPPQAEASPANASEWYDFIIHGRGTVLAPSSRIILNGRAIDADHRFSGGVEVSFRINRASDNVPLGQWVHVRPGQRARLWNNATGTSVTTRTEAATPWWVGIPVTVRAQGFWVFNF